MFPSPTSTAPDKHLILEEPGPEGEGHSHSRTLGALAVAKILGVGAGLVAWMNSQLGNCIPGSETLREPAGSSCLQSLWDVAVTGQPSHQAEFGEGTSYGL